MFEFYTVDLLLSTFRHCHSPATKLNMHLYNWYFTSNQSYSKSSRFHQTHHYHNVITPDMIPSQSIFKIPHKTFLSSEDKL